MSISENKGKIPALIILILSLIVAVGSQTFLAPCVHEDGSFGSCHWAGQMMLGIGGVLLLLSLFACLAKEGAVRKGVYLSMLPVSALGVLTPGVLIALCKMSAMRCRMVMQPAMTILCVLIALAALAGLLMERKKA